MDIAGLLLTGGASTRMGRDKATLTVGAETLTARVARALCATADPVLAVGPPAGSGLPAVDDPRAGPLIAALAGAAELQRLGVDPSACVLLVACDLPLVTPELLRFVASSLGDAEAAIPVVGDRDQPLCAAYRLGALAQHAAALVARGERSMRSLLAAVHAVRVPEKRWRLVAPPNALDDVDTARDWETIATALGGATAGTSEE